MYLFLNKIKHTFVCILTFSITILNTTSLLSAFNFLAPPSIRDMDDLIEQKSSHSLDNKNETSPRRQNGDTGLKILPHDVTPEQLFELMTQLSMTALDASTTEFFGSWFDLRKDIPYYKRIYIRRDADTIDGIQSQVHAEKYLFASKQINNTSFSFDDDAYFFFDEFFTYNKAFQNMVGKIKDSILGEINIIIFDRGPKAIMSFGNTIAINRGVMYLLRDAPKGVQHIIFLALLEAGLNAQINGNNIQDYTDLIRLDKYLYMDNYSAHPHEVMQYINKIFSSKSQIASAKQEELLVWEYEEGAPSMIDRIFFDRLIHPAISEGYRTIIIKFVKGNITDVSMKIISANKNGFDTETYELSSHDLNMIFAGIGKNAEPGSTWQKILKYPPYESALHYFFDSAQIEADNQKELTEKQKALQKKFDTLPERELDGLSFELTFQIKKDDEGAIGKKIRIDIENRTGEIIQPMKNIVKLYTAKDVYTSVRIWFNKFLNSQPELLDKEGYQVRWQPIHADAMWELQQVIRLTVTSNLSPEEKQKQILAFFKSFAIGILSKENELIKMSNPLATLNRFITFHSDSGESFESVLFSILNLDSPAKKAAPIAVNRHATTSDRSP